MTRASTTSEIAVCCGGHRHRVIVIARPAGDVTVALPDHASREAEEVLMALGGPKPGCFQAEESMDELLRSGLTGPEAARWIELCGDATAARGWRTAGIVDPDELPGWFEAGIRDPAELQGWTWAGVARPEQIGPWEDSAGVSGGVQAARWVRPRLVTGPEEIRIWRDAGVDDPDEARLMLKHGREPAAVARARAAALALLRRLPDGGDGRVPTCVSSGTGLVTEIYWYAYGYCCVPAAATHWYAIDFAGDREVRASRRDGLVRHPAVERAGGAVNYAVATVAARRLVGQPPGGTDHRRVGEPPGEARQAPATTSRRTCSRGPGW